MREKIAWGLAAALGLLVVGSLTGMVSGGSLDPTDPPGSTMKTLQEVEPRTPISSLPFTIDEPGSYYLTGNLTGVSGQDGIDIDASGVTIDLEGFTLLGVPGSLSGVTAGEVREHVTVRNGTIRGWGGTGIGADLVKGGIYEDLHLIDNVFGGIRAGEHSLISGIVARSNDEHGILTFNSGIVRDCVVASNGKDGIHVLEDTMVLSNKAWANLGAGIRAPTGVNGENYIEGNSTTNNLGGGIVIDSINNVIVRNSSASNSVGDFVIGPFNTPAPIETRDTPLSHPWANIDH